MAEAFARNCAAWRVRQLLGVLDNERRNACLTKRISVERYSPFSSPINQRITLTQTGLHDQLGGLKEEGFDRVQLRQGASFPVSDRYGCG